jgi:hypothetical protein
MRIPLFVVVTVAVLSASPSFAQSFGQVTGIVADSTGGVLVGANVTVTNTQTGATATQQANSAACYVFPNLLPGIYNVKVEMDGFVGAARNRVELQTQQTIRMDFKLELGTLNETVEAVASAPMISTEDLTIGTVIENRRIVELPLNGATSSRWSSSRRTSRPAFPVRDRQGPRQGGDRSTQQLSIGGGRREWNYFTLDGINNTDVNFNSYIFLPSIDALQEFKVQTGVYSAELGRELGQVSVTTKAGTNVFHGSVFEFVRNDAFDALPYAFAGAVSKSSPFKWNQFGFTLGGPVQLGPIFNGKDKLFFMTNWRASPPQPARDALQRAVGRHAKRRFSPGQHGAQRSPDQRALPGEHHSGKPHRSHLARRCSTTTRRPISQVRVLVNNYLAVNQNETDKNQFTTRVDWVENQKSTWYGRYSWTDESIFTGGILLNGSSVATSAHQVVVDNARVLTNTLVNEVRVGYNNFFNHSGGELNNVYDPISQIGLKLPTPIPPDAWGTPSIGIADSRGSATIPSRRSSIATPTCRSSTTSRGRGEALFQVWRGSALRQLRPGRQSVRQRLGGVRQQRRHGQRVRGLPARDISTPGRTPRDSLSPDCTQRARRITLPTRGRSSRA